MTAFSQREALITALNAFERYAKDSAASWEQADYDSHRRAERGMKAARADILAAFDAETRRLTPKQTVDAAD